MNEKIKVTDLRDLGSEDVKELYRLVLTIGGLVTGRQEQAVRDMLEPEHASHPKWRAGAVTGTKKPGEA